MPGGCVITYSGWIVARTKPQQEAYAQRNVLRQGHQTELFKCVDTDTGRVSILFPGYLFVLPRDQTWSWLRSTYGVLDVILGTAGVPVMMPDRELERIRADRNEVGLVPVEGRKRPRPGQRVEITGGLFWGRQAWYQSAVSDRVSLLLELLGRKVRITVPEHFVEVV